MSWFTRKKQNINKNPKKDLPSDLWIKCPNCGEILYKPELEANNFICHHCNFHFPITSEQYQDIILDKKTESLFSNITSIDTLGFKANKSYEEILEMSSAGSKVLHPRSVELAMKYGIKIHVRSSFSNKNGTMVIKEEKKLEKEVVTGISASDNEANISLKGIPDRPGIAGKIFALLSNANINVDMIVQNITDDGKYTSLTFTVPVDDCSKSVNVLKTSKIRFKQIKSDKNICKVSIVGVGMKSNVGVAKTMFETLAKKNINIQVISTSEIKISVLINSKVKEIALNALHNAYNLNK